MELRLSLGDSPAPAKAAVAHALTSVRTDKGEDDELVLELGVGIAKRDEQENQMNKDMQAEEAEEEGSFHGEPPAAVELSLRPLLPDLPETPEVCTRGFDVNTVPVEGDGGATANYLTSTSTSSVQVEVTVRRPAGDHQEGGEDEENDGGGGGGCGRAVRKKLRLSKEQAAFLEDSFKEHSTLTPKQKSDLANQLNLRPRQVEVWFQNRRARTKLKQTEENYEYLKYCCETLTQENRRLQRELAELRAFPTTHSFYIDMSAISNVPFM